MKRTTLLLLMTVFVVAHSNAQNAGAPAGGKPATGERKGWPSDDRYAFIDECIKTAKVDLPEHQARYYCYCMQERLEKRFPDVADIEKMADTLMDMPEVRKMATECVQGTWSGEDRETFLAKCIDKAKGKVEEQKAWIYCECMLFKVEKIFPTLKEADKLTSSELATPAWKKRVQDCSDF